MPSENKTEFGWFQCRILVSMLSLIESNPRSGQFQPKKKSAKYLTGLINLTLWKISCHLNPKARVLNFSQCQLRAESFFPNFLNRGPRRPGLRTKIIFMAFFWCNVHHYFPFFKQSGFFRFSWESLKIWEV